MKIELKSSAKRISVRHQQMGHSLSLNKSPASIQIVAHALVGDKLVIG